MGFTPPMNQMMMPNGMMIQMQQGSNNQIEELKKKLKKAQEDYEIECKNSKVLEGKCEEYLSQLQRSADIIENSKLKQQSHIQELEDRLMEMEEIIEQERESNQLLDDENQQLKNELDGILEDKNGDEALATRYRRQITEKDDVIDDLREKLQELDKNLIRQEDDNVVLREDKEDLKAENEKLKAELERVKRDKSIEDQDLDRKESTIRDLEDQIERLKDTLFDYKEENIQLKALKENFHYRISDKEKEIERLRGELSMLERIVQRDQLLNRDHSIRLKNRDRNLDRVSSDEESDFNRPVMPTQQNPRKKRGARHNRNEDNSPSPPPRRQRLENNYLPNRRAPRNPIEQPTTADPTLPKNTHKIGDQDQDEKAKYHFGALENYPERRTVNATSGDILTWGNPYSSTTK